MSDTTDADEYEPALESTLTAEAGVESDPVQKRTAAPSPAAVAAAEMPEKIGEPAGDDGPSKIEAGPKMPRRWSDASRALFRNVVKQAAGEPIADDLQPMEHKPAAAKVSVPAAPVAAAPPTKPQVAAPAPEPTTPPPGLPELPDLPLTVLEVAPPPAAPPDPKHAERESAIAAREAALVEREKLLPDRRALIENPGDAMIGWLKDTYGITDDGDLKTAVADLITDLSVRGLKIGVPDEHVNGMQSRKATRVVKVYAADVDKRERALADRTAAQEKAAAAATAKETAKQQEAAYITRLGELIAPAATQHKFLHDEDVTGGLKAAAIVYEVLKEQKRLGQKPDLATATKYADDYYRSLAEAHVKRTAKFQTLLSPAARAAAPPMPAAKPVATGPVPSASPGGAPGPAPTPEAKPSPERAWDPSDLPMDRQQRRQESLAKIVATAKAARAAAQPNT